ncbi:hypothetical protein C8A05DRAFT_35435 [Staphylotrichum tortipilum]|uniref:Uncharacterized protein n=1 Tax=Staphylotrichum tortipilum TaxID=2831512 RepID=A0AAN6MIT0_9PEZI|nr:hypothetical protein C8A05DRAFT_35435 [Staphylotrichum longicolle]
MSLSIWDTSNHAARPGVSGSGPKPTYTRTHHHHNHHPPSRPSSPSPSTTTTATASSTTSSRPVRYAPDLRGARKWTSLDLPRLCFNMTVSGSRLVPDAARGVQFWEGWARFWNDVTMQQQHEVEALQERLRRLQQQGSGGGGGGERRPTSPMRSLTCSSCCCSSSLDPEAEAEHDAEPEEPAHEASPPPPPTLTITPLYTVISIPPSSPPPRPPLPILTHPRLLTLSTPPSPLPPPRCLKCGETLPSASALLEHAYKANCRGLARRARRLAREVGEKVSERVARGGEKVRGRMGRVMRTGSRVFRGRGKGVGGVPYHRHVVLSSSGQGKRKGMGWGGKRGRWTIG